MQRTKKKPYDDPLALILAMVVQPDHPDHLNAVLAFVGAVQKSKAFSDIHSSSFTSNARTPDERQMRYAQWRSERTARLETNLWALRMLRKHTPEHADPFEGWLRIEFAIDHEHRLGIDTAMDARRFAEIHCGLRPGP